MAHPVVFRYLSYSTTFAEDDIHCLRRCPNYGRAGTFLFLSVNMKRSVSHVRTGWREDHGPTNVGAMVKKVLSVDYSKAARESFMSTFEKMYVDLSESALVFVFVRRWVCPTY